jgi:hypothetical protein
MIFRTKSMSTMGNRRLMIFLLPVLSLIGEDNVLLYQP